jgi:hypothetical protein
LKIGAIDDARGVENGENDAACAGNIANPGCSAYCFGEAVIGEICRK